MRIQLLFFAAYRDLAGTAGLTVDAPDGSTADMVLALARREHPRLAVLPDRPVVAVNREVADLRSPLRDGDELALLPPVAGG
jgi:MoaE-MoaD fusion protein